jgi:thiosulfate reductase cytochrome b subunit
MADSAVLQASHEETQTVAKHSASVRVTHWITSLLLVCFLISGIEILISHPRFYWGDTGHSNMDALFSIPIPASRGHVPTGYNFVLKDQNSWSRSLHFQSAWFLLFTGLWYVVYGVVSGHFRERLLQTGEYNTLQRRTYLVVVFAVFPLMFWTGLAMSPTFTGVIPWTASLFGGQQSARTIHFLLTLSIVAFVLGHVWMVYKNGFAKLVRDMITGGER